MTYDPLPLLIGPSYSTIKKFQFYVNFVTANSSIFLNRKMLAFISLPSLT